MIAATATDESATTVEAVTLRPAAGDLALAVVADGVLEELVVVSVGDGAEVVLVELVPVLLFLQSASIFW